MATGFPSNTGDILTASMFNGLVAYTINADNTSDYTATISDAYQVLEVMNKATAIAFKIPTDASVNFPIGSAITVFNKGAGTCTISAVTSGTTSIVSAGAVSAAPTLATNKTAVCIKLAANSWAVVGGIA